MERHLFWLLAAVTLPFSIVEIAWAQVPVEQLRSEMISPWLVTVEGEARLRSMRLTSLAEKTKDVFLVEATYGWIDGNQDPALVELTQTPSERKLKITTPGQSLILVTQSADGAFRGIFKPKSGAEKAIKLERMLEPDLQAKVQAAVAAREAQEFANEGKDWEVAPTTSQRRSNYHSPTPLSIPGAKVVKTMALKKLLDSDTSIVLIDVLDGEARNTIPGAYWMPGAGAGLVYGAEKSRFADALKKLANGDPGRPIIFFCLSSECWLSYNASLLAVDAGYSNVMWFRGGVNAWKAAGLSVKAPERVTW
jgi:PQQ-dependent catabolism-associated CXXCW motif protein